MRMFSFFGICMSIQNKFLNNRRKNYFLMKNVIKKILCITELQSNFQLAAYEKRF